MVLRPILAMVPGFQDHLHSQLLCWFGRCCLTLRQLEHQTSHGNVTVPAKFG